MLRYLVASKTFALASIKRGMHKYLSNHNSTYKQEIPKPDGLHVTDMFDPLLFRPGAFAVHPASHPLKPDRLSYYHTQSCTVCQSHGAIAPSCYFFTMLRCITHGWDPVIDHAAIAPRYMTKGNYPTIDQYSLSAAKEFSDMVAHQVVVPCTAQRPGIVHPLGAVIKKL